MGRHVRDLLGRRYGRLLVVGQVETVRYARWLCRCDCGGSRVVACNHLNSGYVKSCGCLWREQSLVNLQKGRADAASRRARDQDEQREWHQQRDDASCVLSAALGYS